MNDSLVKRIETCIDRWNDLTVVRRHELSGKVTQVSLGLGELSKLHRALMAGTVELEAALDRAEVKVEP